MEHKYIQLIVILWGCGCDSWLFCVGHDMWNLQICAVLFLPCC